MNTGNFNIGALISGNGNVGFLLHTDGQNQIPIATPNLGTLTNFLTGFIPTSTTTPAIPYEYDVKGVVEIPITGVLNATSHGAFTISQIPIDINFQQSYPYLNPQYPYVGWGVMQMQIFDGSIGPFTFPQTGISTTAIDYLFKADVDFPGNGVVAPYTVNFSQLSEQFASLLAITPGLPSTLGSLFPTLLQDILNGLRINGMGL